MTYRDLCYKVDEAAGEAVMTQACPHCGDSNWPGHCPDIDISCCKGIDCARCHGTGRVPLPEAEGAWALLEWLENERGLVVTSGYDNGGFWCRIGEGFDCYGGTPRGALFAAAAKMLEQETL